jgi:hypothetical protein
MIVSFRDVWLRAFFVEERDGRPGLARAAQQSFRETARQSRGFLFDPLQQAMAAGLSVGW